MEPERVRAYLQAACAGLGFDVGEVWWTSSENGSSTVAAIEEHVDSDDDSQDSSSKKKLRFVQLYTSKSYESHRSELLNPPGSDRSFHRAESQDIAKHVLSPRLVDAISNTAQVVWANTKKQEGLTGRSDVRLQTAVGMPVAVDANGNMCVVVMFSPNNIQSTDDSMEFLRSISQSATSSSIPCLLPVFDPDKTGMRSLPPSSNPSQNLFAEAVPTQLEGLGDGVTYRFVSFPETGPENGKLSPASEPEVHSRHELSTAPKDTFGIPMLPSFAEIGNVTPEENIDAFDEASYGVWNTIMAGAPSDVFDLDGGNSDFDLTRDLQNGKSNALVEPTPEELENAFLPLQRSNSIVEESRQERLDEFCRAFLGMSVFDLADVWIPVGGAFPDSLAMAMSVTSTNTNDYLNDFQRSSQSTFIKFWTGAVGRAFSTGNPVWSANPNVFVDPGRTEAFRKAGFKTVLAVPVFSGKRALPTCVVACYSFVRSGSVPFVLRFVQQALRLLWDGLDKCKPHESMDKSIWKEVAPADLGEMAADVEMQQHFVSKKRPLSLMSTLDAPKAQQPAADEGAAAQLSTKLESVSLPDGEVINVPLQLTCDVPEVPNVSEVQVKSVQNHLVDAVMSIGGAVRFDETPPNQNPRRAKRPHVMGHISGTGHSPLQMPQRLPTQVYSRSSSTSISSTTTTSVFTSTPMPPQQRQRPQPTTTASTIPVKQAPFVPMSMANFAGAMASSNVTSAPVPLAAAGGVCLPIDQTPTETLTPQQMAPPIKLCRIQGCDDPAVSRRPYCARHSGNRLCEHEGCKKCAQGSTRFCIAHGGGRRCTYPGCDKGARDKFFCAAHGGGKRCSHEGCTKSAVGGSKLCTAHGGGRRCAVVGCDKSAQSSTKFCVKHGGGKKCAHEGCGKVARGRTQFCAAHGGGIRCKLEGCNRVAIGKMQLCRAHGGGSSRKRAVGPPPIPMVQAQPPVAQSMPQQQDNVLLGAAFTGVPVDFMTSV